MATPNSANMNNALDQIAKTHLDIETLETRKSDALDFHDLAVWTIAPELQRDALQRIIDGVPALMPHLESAARSRATELLEAHRRVRSAARLRGISQKVEPQLPPDILGIYVFLPVPAAGGQA